MIVAAAPMIAQMRKFLTPALVYQIVSPPEANRTAPHQLVMPQRHDLAPSVIYWVARSCSSLQPTARHRSQPRRN